MGEGGCTTPNGLHKRQFKDRHEARTHARYIGGRAYRCPTCGWYHISGQPLKTPRQLREEHRP